MSGWGPATCSICGEKFPNATAIRVHNRDAHGIPYKGILRPKLVLSGDHYIIPQKLREAAASMLTLAGEVEQYIKDTAEARERLKEYQALIDMAKKLR